MNGILVEVRHPDFVENDDSQRESFAEGLLSGWPMIVESESIDPIQPLWVKPPTDDSVGFWFPYGEDKEGERNAEAAVAAMMSGVSLYVLNRNRGDEGETMRAYGFRLWRDVPPPEVATV